MSLLPHRVGSGTTFELASYRLHALADRPRMSDHSQANDTGSTAVARKGRIC